MSSMLSPVDVYLPDLFPCEKSILRFISPFAFANIGIALCIFLSVLGASTGIVMTGVSLLGAGIKNPRVRSRNLISIIFCEAVAIFGVIIGILFINKEEFADEMDCYSVVTTSYAIFFGCLTAGLTNLVCGIAIGKVGSSCVVADAFNEQLFVKVFIVEVFASAFSIFGFIVSGMIFV
ncbi:hypothetical protein P9112_011885 [Eukaryota sp. TZLM1-RC]